MSSAASYYFTRSLRVAISPVAADDVIVYVLALFLLLSFFSLLADTKREKWWATQRWMDLARYY
jgi:hypothetical protein